jgi:hypothetical protein
MFNIYDIHQYDEEDNITKNEIFFAIHFNNHIYDNIFSDSLIINEQRITIILKCFDNNKNIQCLSSIIKYLKENNITEIKGV